MQRSGKIMTQNVEKNESIEKGTEIIFMIELIVKDVKTSIINMFKK